MFALCAPLQLAEAVSAERVNVFVGIFFACAALGPAVGFLLAGGFLTEWVDSGVQLPPQLTPDSYNWVGNWYLKL